MIKPLNYKSVFNKRFFSKTDRTYPNETINSDVTDLLHVPGADNSGNQFVRHDKRKKSVYIMQFSKKKFPLKININLEAIR